MHEPWKQMNTNDCLQYKNYRVSMELHFLQNSPTGLLGTHERVTCSVSAVTVSSLLSIVSARLLLLNRQHTFQANGIFVCSFSQFGGCPILGFCIFYTFDSASKGKRGECMGVVALIANGLISFLCPNKWLIHMGIEFDCACCTSSALAERHPFSFRHYTETSKQSSMIFNRKPESEAPEASYAIHLHFHLFGMTMPHTNVQVSPAP